MVPSLLVFLFLGCASRAPYSADLAVQIATPLEETKANELMTIWSDELTAYLERGEEDWPTRLSQLRDMQTRRGLRPGRICFWSLAAGGDPDAADSLDVGGMLLGRERIGGRDWYLFVVGVVRREDFRPVEIQDIRLTAFATGGIDPFWLQGDPDPQSLKRYWETYRENSPIRFPADDDHYRVEVVGDGVRVWELRSDAEWTLWSVP